VAFAINDRVILDGDHVPHYMNGAVCTVVTTGYGTRWGILSDTDPDDGPFYVEERYLTHVTNVPSVRPAKVAESVVDRPAHYTKWAIEPITFIMRNEMEFWRGNIIKYTARAGAKQYDGMSLVESEITDLEKVRRYAEMRINELKGCDDL
jgi:hypothetical protein